MQDGPRPLSKFRITTEYLAAALIFRPYPRWTSSYDQATKGTRRKAGRAWILKRALDGSAEAVKPSGARFGSIAGIMFRLQPRSTTGNYKRRWTSRQEILDGRHTKTTPEEVDQIILLFPIPTRSSMRRRHGRQDRRLARSFIRNWTQFVDWLKSERHLATAHVCCEPIFEYQRMLSDLTRNPLAKLWLRLSNRLNNEQLLELAHWRRTRGDSFAGKPLRQRHRGESPEFHQKSDNNVNIREFNNRLLRYYRRSKIRPGLSTDLRSLGVLPWSALVLWLEGRSNYHLQPEVVSGLPSMLPPTVVDTRYGQQPSPQRQATRTGRLHAIVLHAQRPWAIRSVL